MVSKSFSVTGLGACGEVGRSAFILDFGEKFLLDYGVKLNIEEVEYPLEVNEHVKAAVISHAHLDHSGLLPYFYKDSNCLSFMTQATLDLADILWKDSIKIAEFEGVAPKYTRAEIERTRKHNFIVPYNKKFSLGNDSSLEFFDAGHILGSALCKFTHKDKTFLYTGDYKVDETQLHAGCDLNVGKVDYLMVESTYGDREQANRKLEEKAFCESVQSTVERGGWAIVPVLAIGRSQEVIDILSKYNIDAPIYFDGMAKQVSEIYFRYPELLKDSKGLKKALNSVEWIMGKQGRNRALKNPGVVVSTSGMMHGGPVMHYVRKIINDPRSKIHLTSYQAEGTPGRELLEKGLLLDENAGTVVKAGCRYEKFDFSAHPSQSELIKSIKKWNPKEIFMVHGDKKVMDVFSKSIYSATGVKATRLETGKRTYFG
ncbi:MAG: Beta-Casp domain protein [archaeon ADurb.Bin336]|nr:MAG: Beta-Casp domain protein [archaeon ADurb.Bin336]